MSTRLGQLTQAVADALNAQAFHPPFTASRAYLPAVDLEQLGELTVIVAPRALDRRVETRTSTSLTVTIDVGVLKKITVTDMQAMDQLMSLVEALSDFLQLRSFESLRAAWISLSNDPMVSPKELNEKGVFLSLISVTYRLFK